MCTHTNLRKHVYDKNIMFIESSDEEYCTPCAAHAHGVVFIESEDEEEQMDFANRPALGSMSNYEFETFLEDTWRAHRTRSTYTYDTLSSLSSGNENCVDNGQSNENADDDENADDELMVIPEGKRKRVPMPTWTGNKQQRLQSRKKFKKLADAHVLSGTNTICKCKTACRLKVSSDEVRAERIKYWELEKEDERTKYLTTKLLSDGYKCLSEQRFVFRYLICNIEVCGPYFESALGASHKKFTDVRRRVIEDRLETTIKTKKNGGGWRGRAALEYIKRYAREQGNRQPVLKGQGDENATDVHLPHGITKESVYIGYRGSMTEEQAAERTVHIGTWYDLWRKNLPQIVCRKYQKFSQCKTCAQLKFKMQRGAPAQRGAHFYSFGYVYLYFCLDFVKSFRCT